MNTNSNIYTVIYTTIVVVIVAAVLAYVSQKLGPMQAANEKAENISQILTAAGFGEKEHWQQIGNSETIRFFEENIDGDSDVLSTSGLKVLNYSLRKGEDAELRTYTFKNGITVVPVYGAGLWGPIWGYIALESDLKTISGAYFDHESETPGLGGKIKDDPSFRERFKGKIIDFSDDKPFHIVKGGAPEGKDNAIDAITGATMTSRGLDEAISKWMSSYREKLCRSQEAVAEPALPDTTATAAPADSLNMEEPSNE